ncbi:MAG: bifunctional riboflavin kinase/FMN adenylyltransferase [Phycisphaerales bacterium]
MFTPPQRRPIDWSRAHESAYAPPIGAPPTAITIGNFDGVHIGHAALVQRARQLVTDAGRVLVLTFDPHPASVLRPGEAPPRLSTLDQRGDLLRALGADDVVRLEPTRDLLSLDPGAFMRRMVDQHGPAVVVEGPDFRFGKGRAGDVDTLRALGAELGFDVSIVDPVAQALRDQTLVRVSSSLVRWVIGQGRVRDAALLLGRPYELPGSVVRGDRRGRQLGLPTANIVSACMSPADGVYAGILRVPDGRVWAAAVNVGERPTFDGPAHRVEAHLLDVDNRKDWAPIPGLPEYGWACVLELVGWVRDQVRFASPEQLAEQVARDCDRVRQIIGPIGPTRKAHVRTGVEMA